MLQWALARGTSAIPKSVTPARIQSNFDLDGWNLSSKQVDAISNIKDRHKVCDQGWLPVKVFFNEEGDAPEGVDSH
jgi:glycerol 2-dehydrogenase (NADP+)